jgi:hypothetical protein
MDCNYDAPNLPRYTKDPPTWRPFVFARSKMIPGDDAKHGQSDFNNVLNSGGFEGQLVASNKPVLLVFPIPQGEATQTRRATDHGLVTVIQSLLTALFADGSIGMDQNATPTLDLLGVSGYSAGGTPAITAFKNNADSISELYLFDPTVALPVDTISKWFKQPRRKLRMVGGSFLTPAAMNKIKQDLLADPKNAARAADVSFIPQSTDFYDTPGNTYHAYMFPPGTALQLLDQSGSNPSSGLSYDTNIFVKNSKMGEITLEVPLSPPLEKTLDKDRSQIEVAGIIQSFWLTFNKKGKITNKDDFNKLIEFFYTEKTPNMSSTNLRHQWQVSGGIGNITRYPYGPYDPARKAFEGHLLFCLKDSSFS